MAFKSISNGFSNKGYKGQRERSKEDEMSKISQAIFITNFPASCGKIELWEIGANHGSIIDVFIPNRLSKAGKRFGFMKFIRVKDIDKLISLLRDEWVGKFRLYACKPRFSRDNKLDGNKPLAQEKKFVPQQWVNHNAGGCPSGLDRNFANMVKGVGAKNEPVIETKSVIMLEPNNTVIQHVSGDRAAFAKVKNLHSIPMLKSLFGTEGFLDVYLKYVGGLWVLIEFETNSSRNMFLKHKGVLNWLTKVIPWSRNFVPRERMVWLDIEGIPFVAWSVDTIKRVARIWGDVVYMDDEHEDNVYSSRVCVESLKKGIVMENVEVDVEGKRYEVRVREVTGWIPSFKKEVDTSQEVDASQDHHFQNEGAKFEENEDEEEEEDYVADSLQNASKCGDEQEGDKDVNASEGGDERVGDKGATAKQPLDDVNDRMDDTPTPTRPPGFTPAASTTSIRRPTPTKIVTPVIEPQPAEPGLHGDQISSFKRVHGVEDEPSSVANSFRNSDELKKHSGFSILERLEEAINFGKSLGSNMEGCEEDLEKLISGIGGNLYK